MLGLRGSVSWLDRERQRSTGVQSQDDWLGSLGFRITSGFFFETRLQLDYNYNNGVIRDDGYGGHEVLLHVSGSF